MKMKLQEHRVLPTGLYDATISQVEPQEGQYGPQVKFTFQLKDHNTTLLGWTSQAFTTKSKLYRWTRAAMGEQKLSPGFILDTAQLVGMAVRLQVLVKQNGDGQQFNKVDDVLPVDWLDEEVPF